MDGVFACIGGTGRGRGTGGSAKRQGESFQGETSVVTLLQKEETGGFPLTQAEFRQVEGPLLAAFWFPSLQNPPGLNCCIYLM